MKPAIAFTLIIFLLAACAGLSSNTETPAALVSETSIPDTLTPTLTPSLTSTPIPDTLTGLWPFLNVELGKIGRKTGHI
jgi:hypothetical protein